MSYGNQVAPQTLLTLDLTAARTKAQLLPPGLAIKQVYIAVLPSGADFRLSAGPANPAVPMVQTGSLVYFNPLTEGLYLDNTAQPGLTAIIAVITGEKGA